MKKILKIVAIIAATVGIILGTFNGVLGFFSSQYENGREALNVKLKYNMSFLDSQPSTELLEARRQTLNYLSDLTGITEIEQQSENEMLEISDYRISKSVMGKAWILPIAGSYSYLGLFFICISGMCLLMMKADQKKQKPA